MDISWFTDTNKALAVVRESRGTVLVFLAITDGRPVPVEVRAIAGDAELDFPELLRSFEYSGDQTVSTTLIQNIPLGEIQRRWMTENDQPRRRQPSTNTWSKDLPTIPGKKWKILYERCWVALRYEQLVMEGQSNPTQLIAEEVYGGNKIRARNVVSAARKDGWLTPATQGKPFGEATEKALQFEAIAADDMEEWAQQSAATHAKKK